MRSFHVACVGLVALLTACATASDEGSEGNQAAVDPTGVEPQGAQDAHDLHGSPEPGGEAPMLGVHHAKGAGPTGSGAASPGNITWHGGAIMTSSVVKTIFWGPSWKNAAFAGDKITGLNRLYTGLTSATDYVASNIEYTGTNGQVGTSVTFAGTVTDLSASPRSAPKTSAVLAEVCRALATPGNGPPVANGYYPVYTDLKRGSAGYCAWHSYGVCAGVPVQFGFFFNLDGDAGCDPQDTVTGHSQGLAALASVSGHEWSETVTDPRNGGWWDSAGNENSDKCAWSFPPSLQQIVIDPISNVKEGWKIQGNWSNAAFNAFNAGTVGAGYLNRDGQAGCMPNL